MIKKRRRRKKNDFRLSLPHIDISEEVRRDILGIFLFGFGVIMILSFLSLAGNLGEDINKLVRMFFGYGFVLFPFLLFFWGIKVMQSENIFRSEYYLFGLLLIIFPILAILHIGYDISQMFEVAKNGLGGGLVGATFAWLLVSMFGKWGGIVLAIMIFLMAFIFTFQVSFMDILGMIRIPDIKKPNIKLNKSLVKVSQENSSKEKSSISIVQSLKNKISGKNGEGEKGQLEESPVFSVKSMDENQNEEDDSYYEQEDIEEEAGVDYDDTEEDVEDEVVKTTSTNRKMDNWNIPPLNLLDGTDSEPTSGDIQANANIIKRTLANFGIQVEMGEVNVGPTVTQYTLKPSDGVKLSKITALQNDLALALAAKTIRIEAPIPGKSWVGIELPNESVAMVTLKTVLESQEFKNRKSNLSMILGRDVSGSSVIANIAKMPHLMIAGSTGSGKTVCVNTLISGLLFQNSPEELKFIMIDPKRVELTPYNDIPHLLTPVIVDPDKAINALKWAVKEMENRYDMLSRFGCRNIESYNNTIAKDHPEQDTLPYIIIIIDEMADLMATHGREMEAVIVRLAQMARAIGIHLVLSTQRPSVEVITGLIKANITTRIAFLVASQIDSRTILDSSGAEKLLGNGDMLYLSGEYNKPRRIQGVFISEEEVRKVVSYIKEQKQEENDYNEEIVETKKFASDPMAENSDVDDDMYSEALEVVREAGKASASLLQRRLRVGYARAARLLDLMENKGMIGPAQGAKPRDVYISSGVEEETEGE